MDDITAMVMDDTDYEGLTSYDFKMTFDCDIWSSWNLRKLRSNP